DAGKMLRDVARLPLEVRQLGREVRGMLAAARSDLQHHPRVRKHALQDRKDRLAVALGGIGIGLHRMRRSFQVATGPSNAPRPRVDHAIPQATASVEYRGSPLAAGPQPAASSAQPKTNGLTTPAPKPTTERTAYATPR